MPYLATARNADKASGQLANRTQARMALDAAARHARANLSRSHASLDKTPDSDSLDEMQVRTRFDADFLNAQNEGGPSFDLEVADVAGMLDLESVPPQVLANLWGLETRLPRAVTSDESEVPLVSIRGLDPKGIVVIDGEWISYGTLDDETGLGEATRGLGARLLEDSEWETDGPLPPSDHGVGAVVLDQRAFALPLWRLFDSVDGEPRRLDAMEELAGVADFVLDGDLEPDLLHALRDTCTVHADASGASAWQMPTRIVTPIDAGETFTVRVADPSWVNPGSTVRVRQGERTELRYVVRVDGNGGVTLNSVLNGDYNAFEAVLDVQVRRPVNLNTASAPVLRALFENLALDGQNARITGPEARELVSLHLAGRPFSGFEDWLLRLVLPAAGIEAPPADPAGRTSTIAGWEPGEGRVIDAEDGLALYINALNANDRRLSFSTMPFTFASDGIFAMELRAAVSAPSGIARTAAVREQVEMIVPQEELLFLFHRQQDYDEALRLRRQAAWFTTGPQNTNQYVGGTNPASRAFAHIGTQNGVIYVPGISDTVLDQEGGVVSAEHTFADKETDGWVQLAPARTPDSTQTRSRILRFDRETRALEGRYLPDETISRDPTEALVGWTSSTEEQLLRALNVGFWIKPEAVQDSVLFDVAGNSQESDRVTLAIEGPDLVLRVLDAFGDHPGTPLTEQTEARFPLAGSPGLPDDTWSHVEIDVAGSRPDQIGLRVNGTAHGVQVLGMTRTLGAVAGDASRIPVESTDGFPAIGVARIGNELIEYGLEGNALVALFRETGPRAGFGGRLARTQTEVEHDPASANLDLQAPTGVGDDHPAGTLVQVYGYSAQLASNLPSGGSSLPSALGDFRVARVTEVSDPGSTDITATTLSFSLGVGLDTDAVPPFSLRLTSADEQQQDQVNEVMQSFDPAGGYAILVQQILSDADGPLQSASTGQIGGVELVRYSGWQGDELRIVQRGAEDNLGINLGTGTVGGVRAFALAWNGFLTLLDETVLVTSSSFQTYCIPVSLAAPGANDFGFLQGTPGRSQFAQITNTSQAENTEWVRYDAIDAANGQLVRISRDAYTQVYSLVRGSGRSNINPVPPGGGGGGGGGAATANLIAPPLKPRAQPVSGSVAGSFWEPSLGVSEMDGWPLAQAVDSVLQFRGVFGTHSHAHAAGLAVLPVFQVPAGAPGYGADQGRPGAMDQIFLSDGAAGNPGLTAQVHRSHTPSPQRTVFGFSQPDLSTLSIVSDGMDVVDQDGFAFATYVALRDPSPIAIPADEQFGGAPSDGEELVASGGTNPFTDARLRGRLSKWPSGERPRQVAFVSIGGSASNGATGLSSGADIPSMTVDEILFGASDFAQGVGLASPSMATQGSALVLIDALGDGASSCRVGTDFVRGPGGGLKGGATSVLVGATGLPEDAGLLRIGEEVVCYDRRDDGTGLINIAPGGRGLLGSMQHHHAAGDSAHLLDHIPVSVLSAGIGPGDSLLPLEDLDDFPQEGLVLVGTELIHFTRQRSGGLEMPRASSEPGLDDERGDGLFRGRFGTVSQSHAIGTPVILFPFRYWDRWTEQADAPEMAYVGLELSQPGALWQGLYWEDDGTGSGQAQIGVLQRANPSIPWDGDPSGNDGLSVYYQGDQNGLELPLNLRADRMEWRVFVRYTPGAFDPLGGSSHGWKESPRLRKLATTFRAPGRVLRSVDR